MSNVDTNKETPKVPLSERWAMGHAPSHLRLWLVVCLGLGADLWTKAWAFDALGFHESRTLVEGLCSFQLSLNPGALFGIGHGYAPIFVGASVLALMFVLYMFANSTASRWSMHIALGLVLGGALGNLYDRTTQEAYVAYVQGGGRVVGTLVHQEGDTVHVGDFPDGENARVWPIEPGAGSGLQPVVRDFVKIEIQFGDFSLWPWIFNIADALLVFGVGILLINFWRDRHHHCPGPHTSSKPSDSAAD